MLVAVDGTGVRRTASVSSEQVAFCPACHKQLVVRVPSRRVAHFAHKAGEKCDAQALRAARLAQRREKAKAAKFAALAQGSTDNQDALFDLDALDLAGGRFGTDVG